METLEDAAFNPVSVSSMRTYRIKDADLTESNMKRDHEILVQRER